MAYDKVVDSTQLETALKAMADAIREKTGDTALIEWLANKGFAEEIAGIEAGGGAKVHTGDITVATDTSRIEFETGLGKEASVLVLIAINQDDLLADSLNGYATFIIGGTLIKACNGSNYPYMAYRSGYNANTKSFVFKANGTALTYRAMYDEYWAETGKNFKAGLTYRWFAIAE